MRASPPFLQGHVRSCCAFMTSFGHRDAAALEPAADNEHTSEGVIALDRLWPLHHGGGLARAEIAWRLSGATGAPIVVALGGISAHKDVYARGQRSGWWDTIVGPGRPLDTHRVRILGIDYLGGSGGTTGPRTDYPTFPAISAFDQAQLLEYVRQHLDIPAFASIVGASYGGMVALCYGSRWPDHVERLVVISAAHRAHPMATAWRSVQRAVVRFAVERGDGAQGLKLARALAMATYRSQQEFGERFKGKPSRQGDRFEFPVERYLLARGDAYAQSYLPESFVRLSESIDLHDVDPATIRTPTTLVAVREDQLVPLSDMRELASRLAGPHELIEVSSIYGHDAFLKEAEALKPAFAAIVPGASL